MRSRNPIKFLCLTAGIIALGVSSAAFGQCQDRLVTTGQERGAFIAAAYGPRQEVPVHLLAIEGCTDLMFDFLRQEHAQIHFADKSIGYAWITVRKSDVLDVLDFPGIEYASILPIEVPLRPKPQSDPKPAPMPIIRIPISRVATTLDDDHGPYFAAAEAGLTKLWQQHPQADGRGVRVAVIDEGFDLLHPALQVGRDAAGQPVPKISDVITLNEPEDDANFVQFVEPVQAKDGIFKAAGRTWTVPHDGVYHFGVFSRDIYLGHWSWDAYVAGQEQEPHLKRVSVSVGVLWDEANNVVWVDTDGDGSFQDQRGLRDYSESHDVDFFGRKSGEDDNRVPFAVKIDRAKKAVYLSIADNPHGAMVAGALAANRLTGGLFDGAAPGAQLVDVRRPFTLDKYLSTVASSFARKDVEVVNISGGFNVPFFRHFLERLTTVYDKPIACFCVGKNVLMVQDYQSPEMLRRNRQAPPPYVEVSMGEAGFVEDGLVSGLLAPSTSLTTTSRYMPDALRWGDGLRHVTENFVAPPAPAGYEIGANPSPTIPVISGILADLISEATREHVRYNVERLTSAILTGTRLVAGIPTYWQSFGVVDALGAWQQLVKMSTADDPHNPELTSFTITRTKRGSEPLQGFHADLLKSGVERDEELWITRHGGYSDRRTYMLSLRGNDETYELLDHKITFTQDQASRVRFRLKAKPGYHLAFLQLIDATKQVVMREVPLMLRAPDVPTTIAHGVERFQGTAPPRHLDLRLVHFGEGTQAARFVLRVPDDGGSSSLISNRFLPGLSYGVAHRKYLPLEAGPGHPVNAAHHVGPIEEFESLIAIAPPSTYWTSWGNRSAPEYETPYDRPAPDVPITGTLDVTRYAVTFEREEKHNVRVTNKLATINGSVEWYDAKLTSTNLTGSGSHAFAALDRQVPAGVRQWRVLVSLAASTDGEVDAYLLSCADTQCVVVEQKGLTPKGALFVVDEPREGNWRIVMRARVRGEQPVSYRVREALLASNSATHVKNQEHVSGARWSVSVPPTQADALYVAFRIAGTFGNKERKNETAKEGLRIAMTPLASGAP